MSLPKKNDNGPERPDYSKLGETWLVEGVAKDDIARSRTNSLYQCLPRVSNESGPEHAHRLANAIEMYESYAPSNASEVTLVRMIVILTQQFESVARDIASPDTNPELRIELLKMQNKQAPLLSKQVADLKKLREGGQQKVTVEHVTVNSGGQAVVGHVETNRSGADDSSDGMVPPRSRAAPKRAN